MSFKKTIMAVAVANTLLPTTSFAATINVDSLGDGIDTQCTLRDALRSVNEGVADTDCTTTGVFGSSDEIVIQPPSGTITLQSLDFYGTGDLASSLSISQDVVINATNSDITIDASQSTGVGIAIVGQPANQTIAVINNIKVSGATSTLGGAISVNSASVTLNNSELINSTAEKGAGAYVKLGQLVLDNSTVSGNVTAQGDRVGGGVYLYNSTLELTQSTISGNVARNGAGVYSKGSTVAISNSTVSTNTALEYGGGVFGSQSTVTMNNSTVSDNVSSIGGTGGVALTFSSMSLNNSLIVNSGGADCYSVFGAVTADNANIIEDGSCNTLARIGDPGLISLSDNGGLTQTHALNSLSIAIDTGSNGAGCPSVDQRGAAREDSLCDVGAYESGDQPPPPPPPPPPNPSGLGWLPSILMILEEDQIVEDTP